MTEGSTRRTWAWVPLLVLVVGLAATAAGTWYLYATDAVEEQARLTSAAGRTREAIMTRVETSIGLLRATAGLFAADPDVTPDEFHAFITRVNLPQNYPGTLGIGYSKRLQDDPATALAALRSSGYPEIRHWPAPEPGREAHAVVLLEPLDDRNRRAVGYDMFSEPVRRAAMERARDQAAPAASGMVRLVQEEKGSTEAGFLIYVPVYKTPAAPSSARERRDALQGFVYAPLRVKELLDGIFGERGGPAANFALHDGPEARPDNLVLQWKEIDTNGGPRVVSTADIAGATWTLVFTPLTPFRPGPLPAAMALAGTLITFALFMTTRSLARTAFELRRSRDALRESEEQFRTSFALAAVGQTQSDPVTGRFIRVNAKFCEMLGYTEEELLSRGVFDVTHPEDEAASRAELERLRSGRAREAQLDKRYIRRDGSVVWARIHAALVRDAAGRPVRTVTVVEDITQRREDHERLARNEALLKAVVETAVDGIITIDEQGRILTLNPAAERIFGYAADEVVGHNISCLMPEPYHTAHDRDIDTSLRTGQRSINGVGREVRGRRKDGSEFPMELAVSETRLRDRRIFTGIVRDISERKAAEEALRASEARFRLMADATPVLIWIADTDQRCTWFNKGWLDFTGRTMERELGRGWLDGIHPDDVDRYVNAFDAAFRRRELFTVEYRLRRADGQWRWILNHGTPLYGPDARFTGYIGSCVDIHDRKQAEEDLERYARELARQAAELARSNADLADFAHVAAHDLKEPLRGIRHTASFLVEDFGDLLGEAGRERLERLDRLAKRMHDLLDALLEFGQVGKSELTLRECDMAAVLNDVRGALASLLQRENALLSIRGPLPRARCDRTLIGQVFVNLVTNALKYNDAPEKRVEIGAEVRDGVPVYYVRDNGIGIDPAYHAAVFRMFKRLHTRDRYGGGSGAGLAIVKRIVERHGGRIWVESAVGRGSTFYFTLGPGAPHRPQPAEQPIVHTIAPIQPLPAVEPQRADR